MLKFICLSAVCMFACVIIKQLRPEFLPLLQLGSAALMAVLLLDLMKDLISNVVGMVGYAGIIEDEYVFLLLRILLISVIVKISSDICKDNGNSTIADGIELVGKIIVFSLCLPLIKIITELASGLLK